MIGKHSIISSKGPTVWVDDAPKKCFCCHEIGQGISINSNRPMFEPQGGRPQVHFCVKCAATVASSSVELLHLLLEECRRHPQGSRVRRSTGRRHPHLT